MGEKKTLSMKDIEIDLDHVASVLLRVQDPMKRYLITMMADVFADELSKAPLFNRGRHDT